MSDTQEKLGAHEVAAWLRRHPTFLKQFPDLALSLVVPRDEGPTASLASYQLEVLRDKNRELSKRLGDLFANAQENERLAVRTHQLALTLMKQGTAADTVRAMAASLQEDFAGTVLTSQTQFIEPLWKSVLSNKGILPLLWQKYQGHPNLLPAFFDDGSALQNSWVRKPLLSREGANIELLTAEGKAFKHDGPYNDSGYIRQQLAALPKFGDNYTLIGSWVVGDSAAGICIREDNSLITKDSSRFLPHIILD